MTFVESETVTLERLNAYLVTEVSRFIDNGTNNAGAYLQKLYQDTITSFLPEAYNQLIGFIISFVEERYAKSLSMLSLSILYAFTSNEKLEQLQSRFTYHLGKNISFCALEVI